MNILWLYDGSINGIASEYVCLNLKPMSFDLFKIRFTSFCSLFVNVLITLFKSIFAIFPEKSMSSIFILWYNDESNDIEYLNDWLDKNVKSSFIKNVNWYETLLKSLTLTSLIILKL